MTNPDNDVFFGICAQRNEAYDKIHELTVGLHYLENMLLDQLDRLWDYDKPDAGQQAAYNYGLSMLRYLHKLQTDHGDQLPNVLVPTSWPEGFNP